MQHNIHHQHYNIGKSDRVALKKHNAFLLWFTGFSGSGKSTIANAVEKALYEMGVHTYTLDGDNIRGGINKNLGFSPEDRTENIRRIAETAKLMIDAGLVVLGAFISPYEKDRENIKNIIDSENYIEIFVNTSLEVCEDRDIKGLYKKARAGEIKDFTGISAPYEVPKNPDLIINTSEYNIEESVEQVLKEIRKKLTYNE